ncbi:MAG: serine peptidase, partial [Anaerolineae bacterium]|nr:serine peptidase [Anaerolineae bacterium]
MLMQSSRLLALALALAASFTLTAAPARAQSSLPDFTELVERVGPAVVNIRTSERARPQQQGAAIDPQMQEFLRRFGIPTPRRGNPNDD